MKILILGLNYAPERVGIAVYTAGMAEALAANGSDIQVIAGQPYYPDWKGIGDWPRWRATFRREKKVRVTRVPHYVPSNPTGRRRLLHLLSFTLTALLPTIALAIFWRPHVVVGIAPALLAAPLAKLAALLCGAKTWLHIQDFEVEAAAATGLAKPGGHLLRWGLHFERLVLRSFDRVSSISAEMCARLCGKGVDPAKVQELRNWAAIEHIKPLDAPSRYRAEWNIRTPYVALYSGNIGEKQGLSVVIDAARRLRERSDITFVICGNGPNRERLEQRAGDLPNIRFADLQPMHRLSDLLGLATVHLLPQIAEAADLVLPSKLGNMLASGRPVIAIAAAGSGLAREVDGCGTVVEPGSVEAFADAIKRSLDDETARRNAADAALVRAHQRWSKADILYRFSSELHGLAGHVAERHEVVKAAGAKASAS